MSKNYQIIARRYRPSTFKEVIGQDSIVQTIKNSLLKEKIAHAYIFSGTRGTGKTTLARLFAKALNCENRENNIEPCNTCKSCLEIAESRSLDVIEIDGASNRGIDDIRQINDTIGYAPSYKYKIYIIDEVHMLTKEAFNALLKTLEEPPENIKFFFATTEAHKILPTIVSRCQRFELKRISNSLIIDKLKSISNDLKRDIENEALEQIANFSEGSLRDAESLLDQIFCYNDGFIKLEYVNQALGFIDYNYFFKLDKKVAEGDILFAFDLAEEIINSGKDLTYVIEELIDHFKKILIKKLQKSSPIINKLDASYIESSKSYSEKQLFYILDILINTASLYKNSLKKIHLETILLKIIKSKNTLPIENLVKRLIEIETSLPKISSNDKNDLFKNDPHLIKSIETHNKTNNLNTPSENTVITNEKISKHQENFSEKETFKIQKDLEDNFQNTSSSTPNTTTSDIENTTQTNDLPSSPLSKPPGGILKSDSEDNNQKNENPKIALDTIDFNLKEQIKTQNDEIIPNNQKPNEKISQNQTLNKNELNNKPTNIDLNLSNSQQKNQDNLKDQKDQSHLDTLMRFIQIELGAYNKN